MPEKNGFVRTIFWTLIIGSFGWATFIGIGAIKAIAGEADKREKCDKELQEKIDIKLEKQTQQTQEMLIMLSEIKQDIKYIKQNGN